MPITIETKNDCLVAEIVGNVDGQTAPEIQAAILAGAGSVRHAILNVAGVPYMSSAGFRTLLVVYRTINAKSGKVVLVGLCDDVRDTMDMTGFLKFFPLAASISEARAIVQGAEAAHAPTR